MTGDRSQKESGNEDRGRQRGPKDDCSHEEPDGDAAIDGNEWAIVGNDDQQIEEMEDTARTPSYEFPGTWATAVHDSSKALNEVGVASKSYYHAISNSGIGQAGWSIGTALAGTANRGALTVANYAINATGANQNKLPSGVRNWLRGKERLDAAKRRAEEAEKARLARKYKRELIERGEVVESTPASRSASRAIRRDSLDEDEGIIVPRNPALTRRRSSENRTTADVDDFAIAETSDEDHSEGMPKPSTQSSMMKTTVLETPARSHDIFGSLKSPSKDSPYGDLVGTDYFQGQPSTSAGWSRRTSAISAEAKFRRESMTAAGHGKGAEAVPDGVEVAQRDDGKDPKGTVEEECVVETDDGKEAEGSQADEDEVALTSIFEIE